VPWPGVLFTKKGARLELSIHSSLAPFSLLEDETLTSTLENSAAEVSSLAEALRF
jgi:hypothetical protein